MGFFDFLKKGGVIKAGGQTWSGDADQRPLDDPDQARKMAELDQEVDNAMNSSDSSSNDSAE